MKTVASFAALIVAMSAPTFSFAQSRPINVSVPGGTVVPVRVVGSISSASEKAGDTFPVQAVHDVVVDGMVVVAAGAEGQGTIQTVNSAGGNGHSGAMELTFDWIYSVDGGKIRLSATQQKQAEEDRKGASSTATIIGVATLGIGGLFGHNLARGRDVVIDGSKELSASVAGNVHVHSSEHAASAHDQFDH